MAWGASASHAVDGNGCNCLNRNRWAHNSAVECHPHTVEVVGSNPTAPTTHLIRRICRLHKDGRAVRIRSSVASLFLASYPFHNLEAT